MARYLVHRLANVSVRISRFRYTSRMADNKLKIGLVGAGTIMRIAHAPTIDSSADVELAAVFDVELERANAITKSFGGRAYDDLEQMLAMRIMVPEPTSPILSLLSAIRGV